MESIDLPMGASARAALPFPLGRGRHFLHRYLDAERRRGLADDPAHHVAAQSELSNGGKHATGVSGDPAGRRSRRPGRPPPFSADHAELDGRGFCNAGSSHAARLRYSIDPADLHLFAGARVSDE